MLLDAMVGHMRERFDMPAMDRVQRIERTGHQRAAGMV